MQIDHNDENNLKKDKWWNRYWVYPGTTRVILPIIYDYDTTIGSPITQLKSNIIYLLLKK